MALALTPYAMAASRIPGTRVTIEAPPGFENATTFSGLQKIDSNASLMVTEVAGPYAKITEGFTKEGLASKGMTLLSRELKTISGKPGIFLEFTQKVMGVTFHKWIASFGDNRLTVIVTGSCPDEKAAKISKDMKAAVLSAKFEANLAPPSLEEGLTFTVSKAGSLKLASRLYTSLIFTPSGKFLSEKAENEGVFVAGQSLSKVQVDSKPAFARKLLHGSKVKISKIESQSDITLDSLVGQELTAEGVDPKGGQTFIYLVVLYAPNTYYVLQGTAPLSKRKILEPQFKEMAATFKIKRKGAT